MLTTGGTLSGDVYEIRLAMESFQGRLDSLGAEIRALRASQDRQIGGVSIRLQEIEASLDEMKIMIDCLRAQPAPEPIIRHELRLPSDPERTPAVPRTEISPRSSQP